MIVLNLQSYSVVEEGYVQPFQLQSTKDEDWLFKWYADGAVLDPFMGTGTSLDAALSKGVPYVGIEIEERYCEWAARRLERAVWLL